MAEAQPLLDDFSSSIGLVATVASLVASTVLLKLLFGANHQPKAGVIDAVTRTSDEELVKNSTASSQKEPSLIDGQNAEAKSGNEDRETQKEREVVRLPKDLRDHLDGKDYAVALEDVLQNTALRPADLDPKVLRLLDMLDTKGTSKAACRRMREALEGKSRQRIDNWRSYVYSLVRSHDPDAYQQMKDSGNSDRPKPPREKAEKAEKADTLEKSRKEKKKHPVSNFDFRPSAPEFVPGLSLHGQSAGLSHSMAGCTQGSLDNPDARAEALLEELAFSALGPRL